MDSRTYNGHTLTSSLKLAPHRFSDTAYDSKTNCKLMTFPVETSMAVDPSETCCHYWLIDRANGSSSRGICKYCHEERYFLNSIPQEFVVSTYNHNIVKNET